MQAFAVVHNIPRSPAIVTDNSLQKEESLPPGIEPLILWQRDDCDKENSNFAMIEVDHSLVRYLRPHQRYYKLLLVFSLKFFTFNLASINNAYITVT